MEKKNQKEKIYDGLFKLSQIMDIKGVQKYNQKNKKLFFYKLYGAFCERKRKLISQKLVINSSANVKKYLWMIKQFYLNNKKKSLFNKRHIELAYQLNIIFRQCSRLRLNQALKTIQGDKKDYLQLLVNLSQKLKLNQAHKTKEFLFQYKQKFQDILKFRLCYFLKNLFEQKLKNNFSIFKYLCLNQQANFKKEYIFQELKNRQQKKTFNAFLHLLNHNNRYQKLKYFLTNFSLIYNTKRQERLKQAFFQLQSISNDQQKNQNDITKKTFYLQKLQELINKKQRFLQRVTLNSLKQSIINPKKKQIAFYMLKINMNDKLAHCFYRLKQNIRLSGQKFFPLIFLLNKIFEKKLRNTYEKLEENLKQQKELEKNQKNSLTNLNLIIQKIFYQNQINAKIKAMNEMKKKIKKPLSFQPNKAISVQNTIKVSNIQKQVIKKNKALKFFAFQRWKLFKDGAVKNFYSLNEKQKNQLRQNQMYQKIEKKINFVCNTQRLENLLKTLIIIRKMVTLRQLKQRRSKRLQKIQQNSCRILTQQLKSIKRKNLRLNLYKMKLNINRKQNNQYNNYINYQNDLKQQKNIQSRLQIINKSLQISYQSILIKMLNKQIKKIKKKENQNQGKKQKRLICQF